MRFRILLGLYFGFTALLSAQDEHADFPKMTPKEEAMEQIFSERESLEAMEKAIATARKLEIPEQAILEAKFLYHVDRAEDAELAKMLPQMLEQNEKFELTQSEIFASKDDWLAIIEYVKAIDALQKGDQKTFKAHITEAFWLSPRQGAAFAPHIERLRLMEAMKDVELDMTREYRNTLDANLTPLSDVMKKNKGMLIHFWSPWSPECEATLADFFITAELLEKNGIGVASMLPETSDEVIKDAKAMLQETGKSIPAHWLIDTHKSPIASALRIQSLPAVVLINTEKKIIFNGHPANEEFWNLLEKLNPEIKRPEMRDE